MTKRNKSKPLTTQTLARRLDKLTKAIEKRSWTSGPYSIGDPALWGLLNEAGGRRSDSGVVVSREAALSVSAFWKGCNIIANGCAKAGFHRYARKGEHGKERDTKHPTYFLVRTRPNDYVDAYTMWRSVIFHGITEGNGYIAIERNNGGTPISLLLLDPCATYPVRRDGDLWYVTSVDRGERRELIRLQYSDVIHIKGLSYDGLVGYSVLTVLCDTIGGAIATRKNASSFYKKGSMLSGVLETPGSMDPTSVEKLRNDWERLHTGVDNSNKTAILTSGMKFSALTVDAKKAQLIEARKFDLTEVANILLLPPHKLGESSRQGYNSLEQEEKSVASDAFDPWWTAIESECDVKLLTDRELRGDTHFFLWNRKASIQTDTKTENEMVRGLVKDGMITVDMGLSILDINPLPNGYGNSLMVPTNNVTMLDVSQPKPDSDTANLDFLREYAKILAADGTISSAVFNLTDAKSLLEAVNIPIFKGYDEPWLPIVAGNGELVSGEMIKDSDGDIVGGDTIDEEPPSTGNGPMESEDDDSEDRNLPEIALKRQILGHIQSSRDFMADAMSRMVRRMHQRLESRIGNRDINFVVAVDGLESEFGKDFRQAVQPANRAIRVLGGDSEPVFRRFFDEIRDKLLLAGECKAPELKARVGFVMTTAQRSCKRLATMAALSGLKR